MAIGLKPKHTEPYSFAPLTEPQFIALVIDAAHKLGWYLRYLSHAEIFISTKDGTLKDNYELAIGIKETGAMIMSKSLSSELMDGGKNKKYVLQFIEELDLLRQTMTEEELDEKYFHVSPYVQHYNRHLIERTNRTLDTGKDILKIFVPSKGFFITPLLIDLNILMFILMSATGVDFIEPNSKDLLLWGANLKTLTINGEWWRLISCCFIHIGVIHMLMNMYALFFIGLLLEYRMGAIRFLVVYLATGVIASTASLWYHDMTISAGASGAIFGMYGVFLALLSTNLIEKENRTNLFLSIGIFVLYNLMSGLNATGIDNSAHIGGLISGAIAGYLMYPALKKPKNTIRTAFVVVIIFLLTFFVADSVIRYSKDMASTFKTEQTINT